MGKHHRSRLKQHRFPSLEILIFVIFLGHNGLPIASEVLCAHGLIVDGMLAQCRQVFKGYWMLQSAGLGTEASPRGKHRVFPRRSSSETCEHIVRCVNTVRLGLAVLVFQSVRVVLSSSWRSPGGSR